MHKQASAAFFCERKYIPHNVQGSYLRVMVSQKPIKPLDPETAPRYMRYIPCWIYVFQFTCWTKRDMNKWHICLNY